MPIPMVPMADQLRFLYASPLQLQAAIYSESRTQHLPPPALLGPPAPPPAPPAAGAVCPAPPGGAGCGWPPCWRQPEDGCGGAEASSKSNCKVMDQECNTIGMYRKVSGWEHDSWGHQPRCAAQCAPVPCHSAQERTPGAHLPKHEAMTCFSPCYLAWAP